jgi:uncharacterized protein YaaW (UPF0174 family)
MNNTKTFDADLNPLLEISSSDDLAPLVEYILKASSQSLSDNDAYKKYNPNHALYADLVAEEIRLMGGNSMVNFMRGSGPSYHEIVCDVAEKLKAPFNKTQSIERIESSILSTMLAKALEDLNQEERKQLLNSLNIPSDLTGSLSTAAILALFKAGGIYSYYLTYYLANAIGYLVLGQGLSFAANLTTLRAASVITGPVGIAATAIWTTIDLAGPAYRVTAPCVIHIAMLRGKYNSSECPECRAICQSEDQKYCKVCGEDLSLPVGG